MNKVKNTTHHSSSLAEDVISAGEQLLQSFQQWLQPGGKAAKKTKRSPRRHRGNSNPSLSSRDAAPFSLPLLRYLLSPKANAGWLGLTIVAAWGCWNGKLLVSTGAGILVMVLVYRMQEWDWSQQWLQFQRFFRGSNRHFALAVGSGGIATLSVYMGASIWHDAESHWLATGIILQNVGILAILGLLVWHLINHREEQKVHRLHQLLADLTHPEPLKRLIAVQQITDFAAKTPGTELDSGAAFGSNLPETQSRRLTTMTSSQIMDCFRLMLSRESDPIVREAILAGLQALDRYPQLGQGIEPFSIPTPVKSVVSNPRLEVEKNLV